MKIKMKWAAAAAAALLTCGVSAQADNYDLTYQAIETQMLIGDVSQFSSELDGAMTKAPAESAKNRSCEEMRIHFFTAPFFVSFFTPGSKKQEEKGILPPFPQKSAF